LVLQRTDVLLELVLVRIGREHALDVSVEGRLQGFGVVVVRGVDADFVVVDPLEQRAIDGRGF
jgi:hypothetical protein